MSSFHLPVQIVGTHLQSEPQPKCEKGWMIADVGLNHQVGLTAI